MFEFIAIAIPLFALTLLIVWRILKLPSRYERHPNELSPWNALDRGIDPSVAENSKE
jgi:hypothetical protein